MKIRTGFVSNSSSEAFICGRYTDIDITIEEVTKILKKMLVFHNDIFEDNLRGFSRITPSRF